MKKSLFAAIVAVPALFALPAGAKADGPVTFSFTVNQPVVGYSDHVHSRRAHAPARYARAFRWQHRHWRVPAHRHVYTRHGQRIVWAQPRPYRAYRHNRPYRFVFKFD